MKELNPRAWIPSLNRYATGYDDLYYHRQMNGGGEWWCYPAGKDEQFDVELELPTGLKDKNGKEIYEGDIVKGGWLYGKDEHVVKYRDYGFYPFFITDFDGDPMIRNVDIEVIGNIHENHELLEGKE